MSAAGINTGGGIPVRDGAVNEYRSPEGEQLAWFMPSKRVIFVNGMLNSPLDHVTSAQALSLLQGCPVIGVFNQSAGGLRDIVQCLTDKINLVGAQAGNFRMWEAAVDAAFQTARQTAPGLTKVAFVRRLIDGNAAAASLYDLLTGPQGGMRRKMPIFSHSQGNLITSNALTGVALALGEQAIAGMEVNSFGSPCRYWPSGLSHVQRAFTFDPVTWLDLNAGFQFDKVGFVAGHSFLLYMQHDAEFTVNRFRWGGWGLTASMDEAGLAAYMIKMGNNPTRLAGILERLIDAHWADSDDVAHIYCEGMRLMHSAKYTEILRGSSKVAGLLERCLEEGYTTRGERTEIDHIKSVT